MNAPLADPDRYRKVMGHFASGVAVITAAGPDGAQGMTVNAIASLSLEPLLLLVCFDNTARTFPLVRETERFGVNVLRAGQEELSRRFASKLPEAEKFEGVAHRTVDGVPMLDSALAFVACDLTDLVAGGDHTIGIGAVRSMHHADEGEPLVWYRGAYTSLGEGRSG